MPDTEIGARDLAANKAPSVWRFHLIEGDRQQSCTPGLCQR